MKEKKRERIVIYALPCLIVCILLYGIPKFIETMNSTVYQTIYVNSYVNLIPMNWVAEITKTKWKQSANVMSDSDWRLSAFLSTWDRLHSEYSFWNGLFESVAFKMLVIHRHISGKRFQHKKSLMFKEKKNSKTFVVEEVNTWRSHIIQQTTVDLKLFIFLLFFFFASILSSFFSLCNKEKNERNEEKKKIKLNEIHYDTQNTSRCNMCICICISKQMYQHLKI